MMDSITFHSVFPFNSKNHILDYKTLLKRYGCIAFYLMKILKCICKLRDESKIHSNNFLIFFSDTQKFRL